jgi:(1->4)-alpha-D-glucan 1-alpha-D-glucosylmutase
MDVDGAKHDHVIAYLRGDCVATVVPRLTLKLDGAWKDTVVSLPEGRWRNHLTGVDLDGGTISVRGLLKDFPVALLVRDGAEGGGGDA